MLAKVNSAAVVGLDAVSVEVEVDIASQGFPAFNIVGLPDKAIEEAKERVRAAIKNSQADFPSRRITVNLSPADLPKQGPAYDLPIALGILMASGQILGDLSNALVLGELSLDGFLRHTPGVLPITLLAKEKKFKHIFLPVMNAKEASIVAASEVIPIRCLTELALHLRGLKIIPAHPKTKINALFKNAKEFEFDFKDIKGQEQAKRALEIAAAGGHNLSMTGPPGSGKTLLARALPSILPSLTPEEALEVTKIYSITGNLPNHKPIIEERPFRSPHHTTSRIGLIGGGSSPSPGEISLAHRGVLFLDEFPEFPRHVLEALRQPMEDGTVVISRARSSLSFPTRFILVTAQNPCPCGNLGELNRQCICTPGQIIKYRKRVSGPLLDRIDLHIEVPMVEVDKLTGEKETSVETSLVVRKSVQRARDIQLRRFKGTKLTCNAEMGPKEIKIYCQVEENTENMELLKRAVSQLGLSARSYHKIIKLSRTIADLAGGGEIRPLHISEALQYRHKTEVIL